MATSNRKKIGFISYDEQETATETINEGIQNINNTVEQPVLTPAHTEALTRLEMVQMALVGKKYYKMTKEKKQELINELIWLTSLSTQLANSY